MAAFENDGAAINWLEPLQERAKPLLDAPLARANMPGDERSETRELGSPASSSKIAKRWSDRILSR